MSEQDVSDDEPCRPRDLAVLMLAGSREPARVRARDQQADRAGEELRRRVLRRVAEMDPEPGALGHALAAVITELGEPSGPARGICSLIFEEWEQCLLVPQYRAWLLTEALRRTDRSAGRRETDGPE